MFLSPATKPRRRQTLERSKTATLPVAASVEPKVGRQSFAAAKNQLNKLKQQQAYGDHSIGQKRHTASGALDYSSATQNATPFDPPASKRQAVGSKVQRPVWVSSVSKRASQAEARMSDDEQMDAPSWEFTDGTQDMDTTGADSGSTLLSSYGEPVGYAQLAAAGSLDDALEAPPDASHVLMQGEKHAVFDVAGFPEAVRQHLGSIDFASVPVSSGVSDEAKFAYVATPTVCLVWSYAGSGRAVNNVYQLAMPDPSSATIFESPIISLVPSSAQQGDVGVIACTATGQLRYWDHIVFGLGGTERFHSKDLGLADINDQCSEILDVYPGLHVVSTKKGFMYQVTLQNSQGLTELGARLLSKSTGARAGMLSRMSSLLGGSSFDAPVAGSGDSLVGLAAGGRTEIRHSREVYALTHQRLQKWVVSRAYPEKHIYSMNVLEVLSRAAGGQIGADVEVSLLDIAVTRKGDVCILAGLHTPRLIGQTRLAVAVLRSSHGSSEPELLLLQPLEFGTAEPLEQDGPGRPRLVLPQGGPGLYIVMRKSVIASVVPTLASDRFEETVMFRDENFLLGFDTVAQFPYPSHSSADSSLSVMCLNAGVLEITSTIGQAIGSSSENASPSVGADPHMGINGSRPRAQHGAQASRVPRDAERAFQHQIEQAVFFGMDNAQNPLSFKITSHAKGVDTALQNAALQVSQSIIDSSSHFIADRMDLGAHLRERYRFAHSVMKFIAANRLSDKLSRTARVQLCANAEKLGAALSLWGYQSEVWSNQDSPSSELLTKVASYFLDGLGLQSKDPVRLFFKHHVASMGGLLATMHHMLASLRRALEKSARGIIDSQHVAYEGNRILICILQSAYNYRFRNAELYGLADESEDSGSCERWTDTILTIDMLAARLEDSYRLCRDISGQHSALFYSRIKETVLPGDEDADGNATGTGVLDDAVSVSLANLPDMSEADAHKPLATDDPLTSPLALLHEAINQIGMMANLCLRVFVDRLNLLQATSPNEAHDLTRRYEGVRSRILLLLVPLGRTSTAFRLAEEYQDLRVLAVLTFTTDAQRAAERVRVYVGMFGKEFAGALFEYYERRGAWASLLNTHDESFDAWLKEYIDAHQHGAMPLISWIHDVKMADFGGAAERLIRAGRDAQEVAQARTMLSLSKLAFFTDESQGIPPNSMDTAIEAHARLEDMLGMCEVQEQALDCFTSLVRAHPELADDGKGAESAAVLSTTADLRQQLPALYAVYREFVHRSWDGKMLAVEDLIDVLTLPDNLPNASGADSSALDEHAGGLDERSSLALDMLSRASFSLPDQAYKSALRTIWRRAFTRDDWPAIHAKLQGGRVPGSVLRDVLTSTHLYRTLMCSWHSRSMTMLSLYLLPEEVFAEGYISYMATVRLAPQFVAENARRLGHPMPVAPTTVDAIRRDYMQEDQQLRTAIDSSLDAYYSEVMRMVVDDAVPERQQELQLLLQNIMPANGHSATVCHEDDGRMEVEDAAN